MSRMANREGHPTSSAGANSIRSRRKRNAVTKTGARHSEFARAFVDALEDILKNERRPAA